MRRLAALMLLIAVLAPPLAVTETTKSAPSVSALTAEALRREAAMIEAGGFCATQRCIILSRVRKQLEQTWYQPPACVAVHDGRICLVHMPALAPDGR